MKKNALQILEPYGFKYFEDCNCTGDYWHKFKSNLYPATEIWLTPNVPERGDMNQLFRIYMQDALHIERDLILLENTLEMNKDLMF